MVKVYNGCSTELYDDGAENLWIRVDSFYWWKIVVDANVEKLFVE